MMYTFLVKHLFGPALDFWRGWNTFENLKALRRSQWWNAEKLRRLQEKKLRALLEHAYRNVPYYHEAFEKAGLNPSDIGGQKDLVKLPLLTKVNIRDNFPNGLVAQGFPKGELVSNCTGGSTGEPLRFYTTNKVRGAAAAAQYRAWEWFKIELGDKCALLVSNRFDTAIMSTIFEKVVNFFRRWKMLRAFEVTSDVLPSYLEELQSFKPKLLYAYPSTLELLSEYIISTRNKPFQPEAICCTGETLYPHQRKVIEEAFGCEVFNFYGARETSLVALECPQHSGLHMSTENAVVEFIADGEQVNPGELGQLVITDLNNYGMPFIRYSIGDVGRPLEDMCPCGRGLPLVKWIEGRISDLIITSDDKFIPPIFFPHLFKEVQGINDFQIIQETKSDLTVKIVKNPMYSKEGEAFLLTNMQKYLGQSVKINVHYVDSIPSSSTSGKRRPIIANTETVLRWKMDTPST